jgi:N-acetyl-anhydromuramyl-L-alanine amidase AmpD
MTMTTIEKTLVDFPEKLYFKEKTKKKQIVLHHTVSGRGVTGDINFWKNDPKRIATHFIINWDGTIYKLFDTDFWAHHLGVTTVTFNNMKIPLTYRNVGGKNIISNNIILNEESIGIEIDAWGGLTKHTDGKYYPVDWDTNLKKYVPRARTTALPNDQVIVYPKAFRGFSAFEKYTPQQIEALKQLLMFLGNKHNIDLTYKPNMWDVNKDALIGTNGVWSHTSYRPDKSDVHPQEELINMLKTLK